jgi:hypothetical protein
MQTRYPVFHAEFWIYVLAAVVIVSWAAFCTQWMSVNETKKPAGDY